MIDEFLLNFTLANVFSIVSFISFNVVGGGPPVGRPIEIRVSHFNNEKRALLTNDIINGLQQVEGVTDIVRDDIAEKPRINLDFNRKSYKEDNLKPQDILTLMFSFKNIGSYKSSNLAVSEGDKQVIEWENYNIDNEQFANN